METENNKEFQEWLTKSDEEIMKSDLPLGHQIDIFLEKGYSKKKLMDMGYSDPLIRQRLNKRTKGGFSDNQLPQQDIHSVIRGTEAITPFHTVDLITNLLDGSEQMRSIFKAGMLVPILGMQLFNEGQKSMVSYMNAMRAENLDAVMKALAQNQDMAHTAAMESAQIVGAQIAASQAKAAVASAPNPMVAMMAQSIQPLFQNVMNNLMSRLVPGMNPPQVQGGQQNAPSGWTISQD